MALPYIQSSNQQLNMLQTAWKAQLDQVLANPLSQGSLLQDVALINGTTTVNHMLGRPIQGWFLVSPKAAAIVHQAASQPSPGLTIVLISNAAVTTDLYVF